MRNSLESVTLDPWECKDRPLDSHHGMFVNLMEDWCLQAGSFWYTFLVPEVLLAVLTARSFKISYYDGSRMLNKMKPLLKASFLFFFFFFSVDIFFFFSKFVSLTFSLCILWTPVILVLSLALSTTQKLEGKERRKWNNMSYCIML